MRIHTSRPAVIPVSLTTLLTGIAVLSVAPVEAADAPAQTLTVQASYGYTDVGGGCAFSSEVGNDMDSDSSDTASLDLAATAPAVGDRGVSSTVAVDTGSGRSGPDAYDIRAHDVRWTYRADGSADAATAPGCGAEATVQVRDNLVFQAPRRMWLAQQFVGSTTLFQTSVTPDGGATQQISTSHGFAAVPVEVGVTQTLTMVWADIATNTVKAGGAFYEMELLDPGVGFSVPSGTGTSRLRIAAAVDCGSNTLDMTWKAAARGVTRALVRVDGRTVRTVRAPTKGDRLTVRRLTRAFHEVVVTMNLKRGAPQVLTRTYAPCGPVPPPAA